MAVPYDVRDIRLAAKGKARIEWARLHMPVLALIEKRFRSVKPLGGLRLGACLHVTSETAALMRVLAAGGAKVTLCASNPLSTQDDVAASLVRHEGIPVFARKGEDKHTYYRHIRATLARKPQITMDDGADLVSELHTRARSLSNGILGGTEETTTGVIRLRSLEAKRLLLFPLIAVNDAQTKHFFDNRYGTGQSTLDGILRATNILLAGATFVVGGYGWCGRGLAMRARGMGAHTVVTEVDPLKALEASLDGFQVMPMERAARVGDIFVTVTGNVNVIRREHFLAMKDGAILANAGHFNAEIDLAALGRLAKSRRTVRDGVEEYALKKGPRVYVLCEGRLVNLASAEGHPASVMDMSFANQALAAQYVARHGKSLEPRVYTVPAEIDHEVARLKLKALGLHIDTLTSEQKKYLSSWELGTA